MNKSEQDLVLGVDIGGSHISAALVNISSCSIVEGSFTRNRVDPDGTADEILAAWQEAIAACAATEEAQQVHRIAIAMPGPFDYEQGISLIKDLHKYENLYGINVKNALAEKLAIDAANIRFRNDAEAFLAGEVQANSYAVNKKTFGITLGTGLGSAVSYNGATKDVNFAQLPFQQSIAEEYLSTRWFVRRYETLSGQKVKDVKEVLAQNDQAVIDQLFEEFTQNLSAFLISVWEREKFETLVIGGNIAKTADRFLDKLVLNLSPSIPNLDIQLANLGEASAIVGASLLF